VTFSDDEKTKGHKQEGTKQRLGHLESEVSLKLVLKLMPVLAYTQGNLAGTHPSLAVLAWSSAGCKQVLNKLATYRQQQQALTANMDTTLNAPQYCLAVTELTPKYLINSSSCKSFR